LLASGLITLYILADYPGLLATQISISYSGYPVDASINDIYSSLAIWLISSPSSPSLANIQKRVSEVNEQLASRNAYRVPPGFNGSALVSVGTLLYGSHPLNWVTYGIGAVIYL
jgi:hypothetical protein